jgi:hypothetical protein
MNEKEGRDFVSFNPFMRRRILADCRDRSSVEDLCVRTI